MTGAFPHLTYLRWRIAVAKGLKPSAGLGHSYWGRELINREIATYRASLARLRTLPKPRIP